MEEEEVDENGASCDASGIREVKKCHEYIFLKQ